MIRRLRVQNFLSLKDTTVDLGPFSIFIGPNASGKTAILKAIQLLSKIIRSPLRGPEGELRLGPGANLDRLVWRGDENLPIKYEVRFNSDSATPEYTVELKKLGVGWSIIRETLNFEGFRFDSAEGPLRISTAYSGEVLWKTPFSATLCYRLYRLRGDPDAQGTIRPFLELSSNIGSTWRYRLSASDISENVYPPKDPRVEIHVGETGWGLAWVLRRISGTDKETFAKIEDKLKEWFPHIKTINFEEERTGVRLAFTSRRSDKLIGALLESDGVLHALVYLWRIYTATKGDTVCFEEPENGTHPYRLRERHEFLREHALGPEGARVLVTSHSPDFLSCVDPAEAQQVVRIVEFDAARGTAVYSLRDLNEADRLFEVFKGDIGELWWSGAIGGVPRRGVDLA